MLSTIIFSFPQTYKTLEKNFGFYWNTSILEHMINTMKFNTFLCMTRADLCLNHSISWSLAGVRHWMWWSGPPDPVSCINLSQLVQNFLKSNLNNLETVWFYRSCQWDLCVLCPRLVLPRWQCAVAVPVLPQRAMIAHSLSRRMKGLELSDGYFENSALLSFLFKTFICLRIIKN